MKTLCRLALVSALSMANLAATSEPRLVDAVKRGDTVGVRSMLKARVDVNTPEADGATPLAWAVHRDDLETADLLIRAGANVNAANDHGATPLTLAATNGNAAMIERLLAAGANPNAALPSGETALMTAARTGSAGGAKALLVRGANVNAKENRRGQDALMWAAAEKHVDVARVLIEHGADVRARSGSGFTALLFAAQQGDQELARVLLDAGADVNAATPSEEEDDAPAGRRGLGSATLTGMTPLLMAAASGHEALAIFFLERGANPNAADSNGATALHYSLQRGMSIVDALFSYLKASSNWFRPHMRSLMKELFARGADPNARLSKHPNHGRADTTVGTTARFSLVGATPFMLATASLDLDLMRYLMEQGADPMIPAEDQTTTLIAAGGLGHTIDRTEDEKKRALEAVKMLVAMGADVNTHGYRGYTALHGAAYVGDDEVTRFLVEHGAKMDVFDNFGQTPLSIAEGVITTGVRDFQLRPRTSHRATGELLLKLGATPVAASGVKILAVEDGLNSVSGQSGAPKQ